MRIQKLFVTGTVVLALTGCSSTATKETVPEASATTTAEAEEIVTSGKYTVTNTTGETITELYLYETGTDEKGENYAGEGLAADASVTIEISVDEAVADGYASTLEFTTESGVTSQFTTLHLEEASMNLLSDTADTYTSATPFEWSY